jgi:hypothetical protein
MTPKEKAEELINRFRNHVDDCSRTSDFEGENAKECALISLEYIISCSSEKDHLFFWKEVKKEVEKHSDYKKEE